MTIIEWFNHLAHDPKKLIRRCIFSYQWQIDLFLFLPVHRPQVKESIPLIEHSPKSIDVFDRIRIVIWYFNDPALVLYHPTEGRPIA